MPRPDPKEHSKLRKLLADEEAKVGDQEVVQSIVPIEPEAALNIFKALKSFGKKFPEHAPGLISRVGKMLKATDEEMAARLEMRPRNHWEPNLKPQGSGGELADAGSKVDRPVDVSRTLRRRLPEAMPEGRLPQGPNAARAAQAPIKAAEKIVGTVEQAIKKVPKK